MSKPMHSNTIHMRGFMRRTLGFTLIEMMVAVVLGVLVSGGIISLFASTSRANRVQTHLARLQENGRFVIATMNQDLQMANAQYCSNTGGSAELDDAGYVFQAGLRSPTVLAKNLVLSNGTTPAFAGTVTGAYSLPSNIYLAGYDCTDGTCSPSTPPGVPAAGTDADDRVRGADVLTMRYVTASGWAIEPGATSMTCSGSNSVLTITIDPKDGEPPAARFEDGDLAMLADCSQSQVFAVERAGVTTLTPDAGQNFSDADAVCVLADNAGRLFDFSKDFITVTYFLQLKEDDNPDAATDHLIGVLMRKVNGGDPEPLVRGVGRLDFRFGVENDLGETAYLTAEEVDDLAGGALTCPPGPPLPPAGVDVGCLWRAVKAFEVNVLLNSVDTMSLPDTELAYSYAPDGAGLHTPPNTMTNGLDRTLMRRGFTTIVSVRNYNP